MNIYKKIWKGCGHLPGYEAHQGTPAMIALLILGVVAGIDIGLKVTLLYLVLILFALALVYFF